MARLPLRLSCCLLASASLLALGACNKPESASAATGQTVSTAGIEQARQLKEQGNLQAATSAYEQLLAQKPDAYDAAAELASLYRKNGQPDKALALMQSASAKAPSNPNILTQLGYALIDTGQPEAAIGAFDQLSAIRKDDAAAYNGKAVAYDNAGNHYAAQELYRHALELSPGAVNIQNNLGMSLILSGQAKQAVAILEPLYASDHGNKIVRQNLAMAYGMSGENKKALALNKMDYDSDTAKENLRYYKAYAKEMAKQQSAKKNIAKLYQEAPQKTPQKTQRAVASKPVDKAPALQSASEPEVSEAVKKASADADKSITDTLKEAAPSAGAAEEKPQPPEEKSSIFTPQYNYPTRHGDWQQDNH